MKKKIVLFALLLYGMQCFCQLPGKIWYFGENAGLDFNSGSAVAITDGALRALEGSAAMCDAEGNIMFYTEGKNVWNKNHELMENGTGLMSDFSARQAAVIVPKPGSETISYIFTTDAPFISGPLGLHYSEVDMGLMEGLGAVTSNKNIQLLPQATEQLAVARHTNNSDIWVIAHSYPGNSFRVYKVTANGVNTVPVTSNVGFDLQNALDSVGTIKVAPSGDKIAVCLGASGVQLLDFNPATGIISNPINITDTTMLYDVEFSPSGSLLYTAHNVSTQIVQYNLLAADIAASAVSIWCCISDTTGGAILRAPDGKIYHSSLSGFSVIHNPDVIGAGCNYQENAVNLNGGIVKLGLCASVQLVPAGPDFNLEAQNFCLGNSTAFSIVGPSPDSVTWDFGDGTAATGLNPSHTYASAGNYTVMATIVLDEHTVVVSREITIHTLPSATLPDAIVMCDGGNDGIETFDLVQRNAQILGGQSPADFTVSYHLTQSDAQAGINPLGNSYTNVANPEVVHVRVANNATACHTLTTLTLALIATPEIVMDDTAAMCEGGSVTLSAPSGFETYQWSNGAVTQSIEAVAPGAYTVTVSKVTGTVLCQASKTVTVNEVPIPVFELDDEYSFCKKGGVWVRIAEGFDSYAWSGGETTNAVVIGQEGNYSVTVTHNGCATTKEFNVKEIMCGITVPKGISPNGDGNNDKLDLAGNEVTHFSLYNRYGMKVYEKDNYTDEWHGQSDDGKELPTGTYFYSVRAKDRLDQSGWIYLNREM